MTCDRYFELLSAQLDRELTKEEAEELELHRAGCLTCRMVGAQMDELRDAFAGLEDTPAPEGFAQGVMDRIQKGERTVIPLFKRPQFRTLAGLAACLMVVVGLYGAARQSPKVVGTADGEDFDLMARSFEQDALVEDGDGPRVNAALVDPEPTDVPQIAAYAAPGTQGLEKAAPDAASAVPQYYGFQNDQYIRVSYGYTPEPGARIIGSGRSLENFLAEFSGGDFSEVQAQYDEGYFETGRLLAAVVEEPSGSIRHQIIELTRDQVVIEQTSPPCTDDMAAWLILAEVDAAFHDGDELELTVIPCTDDAGESGLTAIHEEDR